jgi:thiol-disulfide isomerase/thioredoxin
MTLFRAALAVLLILSLSYSAGAAQAADTGDSLSQEFSALQKKLEDEQPDEGAPDKDKIAFVEKLKSGYGDFALKHPKTPQGFNAALTIASLLNRIHDADLAKYAEMAANCAPEKGIDPKSVCACWCWVGQARLEAKDEKSAREAVEKIKAIDADVYDKVSVQFNAYLERLAAVRKAEEQLKPGNKPYPIEETDFNDKKFKLADWQGKVVVVEFWSINCPICMGEMPNMVKLYGKFHDKGLEIVGVNLDPDPVAVGLALKEKQVTWTTLLPSRSQSDIAEKWGIMPIPRIFVIDRKGVIRHLDLKGEELASAVEKLVAE